MKIWITTETLTGSRKNLLRPGALYGLKRLQVMTHETGWDSKALSKAQLELLENERIRLSDFTENEADARVLLNAAEEKLVFNVEGKPAAAGPDWFSLVQGFLFPERKTSRHRKTAETDIRISLNLDGSGSSHIETGLRFFDHMLEQIARHGLVDLDIRCSGDLNVDEHHTIEDVAITLGEALFQVCGTDKTGIQRYGFLLAMDESQAEVALDLSGRPYFVWNAEFRREYAGDFPLEMAEHFFHTLAMNLKATLQIRADGKNDHHKLESIFKGFARSLRFAVTRTERSIGLLPSSKELL